MTLIEENPSVSRDYNLINNALNAVLFNGRCENKHIYLDFEGEMRFDLAEKLSQRPAQVDSSIWEAVVLQMDLGTKNPFSTLTRLDQNWKLSGFDGFPPTTLFLCSLSLVAERMRTGRRFSINNYYQRFMDTFQISKDSDEKAIRSQFKCTETMWRNFNAWLTRNDGIFGLPTAKSLIPTRRYIR